MKLRRRDLLAASLGVPALARAGTQDGFTFTLQNGSGQLVTPAQFRGRYLLVFFGYTRCTDTCPITLYRLAWALRAIDPDNKIFAALFITIDPAHDSPQNTARYAANISPRIQGLSGSPAQIAQAIAAFHVYVTWPNGPQGAPDHSALVYLLAPTGELASVLPDNLSTAALIRLLQPYSQP